MKSVPFMLILSCLAGTLYADDAKSKSKTVIPPLPDGITSFGAAVVGDYLYVYGGHKGRAHHYSVEGQSNRLQRVHLHKPSKWTTVATGPRLQGLALLAHKGKLYRIGGFSARNQEGAEHDLHSVADVARFDPAKGKSAKWEALPSLPLPRSSHDAVIMGDRIYVVGGWQMRGSKSTLWHNRAHSLDLSASKLKWEEIPKTPFKRRALSLGQLNGKLYVIGGMQQKGGPTTRVDIYDPEQRRWQQGPALVGEGMEGFGSSAFQIGKGLYVSTYSGNLQQLTAGKQPAWSVARKLRDARFFHRMVPFQADALISVGGANMESGKFLEVEIIGIK